MTENPSNPSLNGIIPIVAATFTSSGLLDEDSFQALVRHLMGTGASGLTLFGLVTEFYKLTDAEKARLQSLLLAETTGRSAVAGVISITDHSWETAVPRAQAAEAEGADALMLLPPFFLAPSEAAILDHIRRVVSAVRLPVIVQYAPNQTGVRLPPELFVRLRETLPNLNYVKVETQPPGPYVAELLRQSNGKLQALVGYAGVQMPDALTRGAAGIQPGCSFTEVYVKLHRDFQAGNMPRMLEWHQRLLPYIGYWMQGIELIIAAEKRILRRRGLIASDYCRHPGYTLDPREEAQIEAFLGDFAMFFGR